jgi:hypothetical protein
MNFLKSPNPSGQTRLHFFTLTMHAAGSTQTNIFTSVLFVNLFCLFFITSHKIHQQLSSREATESKYIFIYKKLQFSPLQSSKG